MNPVKVRVWRIGSVDLIITNHHVVKDAAGIKVNLARWSRNDGEVRRSDPKSDVAVIRISEPPNDLKPIPLGSSEALRLGETVLAVGNPFGLGHTVTMGSYRQRSVRSRHH